MEKVGILKTLVFLFFVFYILQVNRYCRQKKKAGGIAMTGDNRWCSPGYGCLRPRLPTQLNATQACGLLFHQ